MKLLRRHDVIDLTAAEEEDAAEVAAWLDQVVEATSTLHADPAWVERLKVRRKTKLNRPPRVNQWKWQWNPTRPE